MNICTNYAALLDAYVDGELAAGEAERVRTHLETCPDCRAYVDDALAIRAAFPTVEETPVPEGFAESILARLGDAPAPQKKPRRQYWSALAPLAACFAVVLIAGSLVRNRGASGGSSSSSAAPAAASAETYSMDATQESEASAEVSAAGAAQEPATPAEEAEDLSGGSQLMAIASTPESAALDLSGTSEAEEGRDNSSPSQNRAASAETPSDGALLLPQAAEPFLSDYEPTVTEDGRLYTLTAEEYDRLLSALADAGIEAELPSLLSEEPVYLLLPGA